MGRTRLRRQPTSYIVKRKAAIRTFRSFFIIIPVLFFNSCTINNRTNAAKDGAGMVSLSYGKPPANVKEVVATLARSGFGDHELRLIVADTGQSASYALSKIPAGTWHLHVDALRDSATVKFAGDAELEVIPDQTTEVALEIIPTRSSIGINAMWSGNCAQVTDGLASWWRFEELSNDLVGSNHGITLDGGGVYVPGMVGKAISLQGGGYVRMPNSQTLSPSGSFTFDAWIYPTKDERGVIIGKWGDEFQWANERSYGIEIAPGGNMSFGISDFAHQNDSPFHILYSTGGKISLFSWNHIACVYDQASGQRSIYINGSIAVSRTDAPITVLKSAADLTIGLAFHSPGYPFNYSFAGRIDELCYYQRALSADEVKSIFRAGSQGKCRK